MGLKLLGAAIAAFLVSAPADAATFVRYTFEGAGSGTIYNASDPDLIFGKDVDLLFTGTMVVDTEILERTSNASGGEFTRLVFGDSVIAMLVRGPFLDFSILNIEFEPGALNGHFPTELTNGSPVNGLIELMIGAPFSSLFGTGYVTSFIASSAPDAPTEMFEISANIDPGPVSPVPEPSTWAMMILGFGAIGAAMRRPEREKLVVTYA